MQFTDEVAWRVFDFVVASLLLFGAGLIYVLLTANVASLRHKLLIGAIVLILLVLIWAELAVDLIGTPWAGS